MNIYLCNLGCVRNQVDGEVMLGALEAAGYETADDPAEADAIIVNTCGFIQSAAEESLEEILEFARYKQYGPCRRLIVTGCLPERYRQDTAEQLPEVDVFLGTGAYDRVVSAVEGGFAAGACELPPPASIALMSHQTPRHPASYPVAYVKVTEGCNRHCTYCIIPKLRGRLRSRPVDDIRREVSALAAAGYKEIVVVGQDTTSYGADIGGDSTLARLLDVLARTAPHTWIRFLYGHPDRMDAALLDTVFAHENLCNYFDIPIQHVSAPVLRRMGRGQDSDGLKRLFDRIRGAIPDAALRTTMMVGFPGETDADFNRMLDFVDTVKFDHLGAFIYSDADDLPAHRLAEPVAADVAQNRLDRLMFRQAEISMEINRHHIGRTYPVLVEAIEAEAVYAGRTMFQAPEVDGLTTIFAEDLHIGQWANVRITDATEYDIEGVPV
ncbi:MAG: 30S ribosomal protein S12 methylthiotransferase RimO [Thermodesulfobacteriota bacterium]